MNGLGSGPNILFITEAVLMMGSRVEITSDNQFGGWMVKSGPFRNLVVPFWSVKRKPKELLFYVSQFKRRDICGQGEGRPPCWFGYRTRSFPVTKWLRRTFYNWCIPPWLEWQVVTDLLSWRKIVNWCSKVAPMPCSIFMCTNCGLGK